MTLLHLVISCKFIAILPSTYSRGGSHPGEAEWGKADYSKVTVTFAHRSVAFLASKVTVTLPKAVEADCHPIWLVGTSLPALTVSFPVPPCHVCTIAGVHRSLKACLLVYRFTSLQERLDCLMSILKFFSARYLGGSR